MVKYFVPHCRGGNFLNFFKAPTPRNQNLAKVDSRVGRFKIISWEPGLKPPQTALKTDKSGCTYLALF